MTWSNKGLSKAWKSVAMSSDGTKRVAVADDIYISTDSGDTWTAKSKSSYGPFTQVCMSANGSIIVALATAYNGGLLKSTDGGSTWSELPGFGNGPYSSVAMSDDGNYITFTSTASGKPQFTTDGGGNLSSIGSLTSTVWSSVAMSANGQIQYVYSQGSGLYKTTNGGSNWSWFTALGNDIKPQGMSCSADGLKLVFARYNAGVTVYNNGTWNIVNTARNYVSADISDNGQNVVVGVDGGYIYTSSDAGVTLTQMAGSESLNWKDVALTSDGSKLTAVADGEQIRVYMPNLAPTITSGATANFAENGTGVAYTITASDTESDTLVYSLETGGTDNGLFNVNTSNGEVTFKVAPNFESKSVHAINVGVSDGTNPVVTQNVTITVTDVNETVVLPPSGTGAPVVGNGGTIVGKVTEDPRINGVTYNSLPLPPGSVLRNTNGGQKFIAGGASSTDFVAIEITPKVGWGWNTDGSDAWAVLQSK